MFSGLVRHIGRVREMSGETMIIESDLEPQIGASIAVNGVCLTAMGFQNRAFSVALSKETRDTIALENMREMVHLEEAVTPQTRLDGHIVQGHIDGIGTIRSIVKNQNGFDMQIAFPPALTPLIVPKGSIAIDGVSLTINALENGTFRLTIIPHTFQNTLFHTYKPHRRVHIETDIINRAVFHILQTRQNPAQGKGLWREIDAILAQY